MKKNKNNIPGNATPAPANAENNATKVASVNHYARDARKEAARRSRTRRMRSLMKIGYSKEEINDLFKTEDDRLILCLYYDSFHIENGTEEAPNILRGKEAVEEALKRAKITPLRICHTYCYIKTTKDDLDAIMTVLKPIGRATVTKPENVTAEKVIEKKKTERKVEQKANRKPSNNTSEAKKNAKACRKEVNLNNANMRPYYAALRKGGVSTRIKKHNPTLAEKIEKWIKEKKVSEASRTKGTKEERAKHRQLTSLEMKANRRARKVAKALLTKQRRNAAEMKRAEINAKLLEERVKKAQTPIQTELKMVALL